MPTDEKVLGFGNQWYQAAMEHATIQKISSNLKVRVVTAPYFLATKLEAFKTRGKNDFLGSHDFEDIITVIDGRAEIVNELSTIDVELKSYLKKTLSDMLQNDQFSIALPGHLDYGPVATNRSEIVLERIKSMISLLE